MTALPTRSGAYCAASPGIGGATLTQVTLDTLDTVAYPYTAALSGGGLVVRGTGPIVIYASVKVEAGMTCTATVKVNGVAVSPTGNTANLSTLTYAHNGARNGDVLTLWETDTGTNTFTQHVTGGVANTFLHYEVPTDLIPGSPAVQSAALF
jgi:hypothetical protein